MPLRRYAANQLRALRDWMGAGPSGNNDHTGVDWGATLRVADYGNIASYFNQPERSLEEVHRVRALGMAWVCWLRAGRRRRRPPGEPHAAPAKGAHHNAVAWVALETRPCLFSACKSSTCVQRSPRRHGALPPVLQVMLEVLQAGAIPIGVGGTHVNCYAMMTALAQHYGPKSFAILHVDAHYDAYLASLGRFVHNGEWGQTRLWRHWQPARPPAGCMGGAERGGAGRGGGGRLAAGQLAWPLIHCGTWLSAALSRWAYLALPSTRWAVRGPPSRCADHNTWVCPPQSAPLPSPPLPSPPPPGRQLLQGGY